MGKRDQLASFIIMLGIIFFSAMLVYALYRHSINVEQNPSWALDLIAISGLALFCFAIRLRAETRVNFVLSVFSGGLGIYLIEIYVVLTTTRIDLEHLAGLAEDAGVSFDRRSKMQVLDDLRSEGVDVFPSVIPALFAEEGGLVFEGE
jgi:hypothetical protein